jgi:hypothetical protein
MAALLTRTSTVPKRSTAACTMAAQLSGSVTSVRTASARPPAAVMASAVSLAVPSLISAITTAAPSAASASA